eukprot:scaffold30904_cov88-Phaeocystis_antarctica.AAC.7
MKGNAGAPSNAFGWPAAAFRSNAPGVYSSITTRGGYRLKLAAPPRKTAGSWPSTSTFKAHGDSFTNASSVSLGARTSVLPFVLEAVPPMLEVSQLRA